MPDPQVPIDCPVCGAPLIYLSTYQRTDGETHFYRCPRHGVFLVPPNGRIQHEKQ